MNEWEYCKIKDIGQVKGGKRLPAGSEFSNGITPFPYLRVTDMINASIDDSNIVYVSKDIEEKIKNYKIAKDDIYVTIAGTLGNFGIIPDKFNNAQLTENAAKITSIDFKKFDKYFLVYNFNSIYIQKQIKQSIGVGGGVPKLALFRIENLDVKYPPIEYQHKIARILTTIDKVIEQTENTIEKLKKIKQGMMHNLFTRGIDVKTGKLRPPYSEAPELYKQSELGWIPREWEVRNILTTTYIKGRIGWQGLRAEEFIEEGPYLVTGTDFYLWQIDWANCYHVSDKRFKEARYIHLKNEDVLITKDGTIGKTAYVNKCPNEAVLNSGIFLLRCKDGAYINRYLFHLLNSVVFDKYLYKILGGSTIVHLYQREFEKFCFPVPLKNEQEKIIQIFDTIINKIQNEQCNLEKNIKLKQGLMQDLLTGKVEVTPDPQDSAE